MKKKIVIGLAALGTAVALVPLFAAFEAHVINVTAKIENALLVPVDPIAFGTVFPQEQLERTLPISLSQSFLDEDRVDDVEYIIRQKPKCGVVHEEDGTVNPSWTGHVVVVPVHDAAGQIIGYRYSVDCEKERPINVPSNEQNPEFYLLPSLCQYLSKHSERVGSDTNGPIYEDGSLASFHQPFTIDQNNGAILWNDVGGRLAKSVNDILDTWTIDLKVPCFGGYCAQDWEKYVTDINPNADPAEYTQPIGNEHKVFGCNLWVEVKGVSETPIED